MQFPACPFSWDAHWLSASSSLSEEAGGTFARIGACWGARGCDGGGGGAGSVLSHHLDGAAWQAADACLRRRRIALTGQLLSCGLEQREAAGKQHLFLTLRQADGLVCDD